MERHFKPGTIIQHFKRETLSEERLFHEPFAYMYKVIGEGMNTETKEKLLIYQALYGSNVIFARPLDMAMDVVDKEKYPDIKQEYRLEEINNENINSDKLLWNLLEKHIGHEVHIVSYGDNNGNIYDVCLECEDCNEVILDSELYTLAARNDKEA